MVTDIYTYHLCLFGNAFQRCGGQWGVSTGIQPIRRLEIFSPLLTSRMVLWEEMGRSIHRTFLLVLFHISSAIPPTRLCFVDGHMLSRGSSSHSCRARASKDSSPPYRLLIWRTVLR